MTYSEVKESPSKVYGQTEPQISKRLGVFEQRKYCRRTGYPFSNNTTNDPEMLSGTNGVKITRSGYYAVSFCSDQTTSSATKEHRLNLNGAIYRQVGLTPSSPRNYVPGSALMQLNAGDVLTISVADGSTNDSTATYIEVLEIGL